MNADFKVVGVTLVLKKVKVRVELLSLSIVDGLKVLESPKTHPVASMGLVSNVTAPVRARAWPSIRARVFTVMLANAIIVPLNSVSVPRVAELPTRQKMLHLLPVPSTEESDAVVSVEFILKT